VPTTPKPKTPPPIDSLGSIEKQLGPKGRLSFSRVSSLVKRLDFRSFAERDWPKQVGGRYFSHAIRAPDSDEEVHDGLWLNGPYDSDSEEEEEEAEGPLEAPEEFQYPDPEELEQALPCEFQYPDSEELEALLRELPHPDPEELEQALPRELPHPDPEELGQVMEEIEKVALEPPVQVEEVKENRDLVPALVEE